MLPQANRLISSLQQRKIRKPMMRYYSIPDLGIIVEFRGMVMSRGKVCLSVLQQHVLLMESDSGRTACLGFAGLKRPRHAVKILNIFLPTCPPHNQ